MASVVGIQLQVTGQQQAAGALSATGSRLDKFRAKLQKASLPSAAAAAGVLAFAKAAGSAASDVQQAMGGVESVFGKNAQTVKDWARDAADSVGLAQDEYATAASKFGAQFKNMGLAQDAQLAGTKDMISLGADLAATFGGSTQDAVDALSAAFRGEADSAERYGLNLSMTAVNAELARKGQDKLTGSALAQAKAATIMELATKQAGGSIGQFGRESDTAAGAQERARAQWKNAQADLGAGLLPIMQKAGTIVAALSRWMSQNTGTVKIMGAAIIGAALAIRILNTAMNASPIARIIALVAAVAAGLVVLYQKSATFRAIVTGAWNAIRTVAVAAWGVVKAVITGVWTAVSAVWNVARGFFAGLFGAIRGVVAGAWAVVKAVITGVWTAVAAVWNTARGFFAGLFDGIRSAAAAVWGAIRGVITAVVGVVRTVWNGLTGFFAGLWSGISNAAGAVWDGIGSAIGAVVSVITTAWDALSGFFTGLWDGISSAAGVVWDGIGSAIGAVVSVITTAWDALSQFFSDLWTGIRSVIDIVWGGISGAITGVVDAITGAWDALTEFFRQLWEGIKEIVRGVWDWIMARVEDVKGALADLFAYGGNEVLVSQYQGGVTGTAGGPGTSYGPVTYSPGAIVINVTGAGRPDATARAIARVLTDRENRSRGLVMGRG